MKKTLILAIMAGAALAGCVKNEPIATDNGSPSLITFEAPVVNVPTKATEIVGDYPTDADFSVFALYYANNYTNFGEGMLYMDDVKCTKKAENNYWEPAQNHYWPKTGKLTFAAYAPAAVNATWGENGFTFTDFTVGTDAATQFDLLYSDRVYDKVKSDMLTPETKDPYEGITIPFKHALSSIVFAAKTNADYSLDSYTIKITGITVNNVVGKGTFNQGLTSEKPTEESNNEAWTLSTIAEDKANYTAYNNTDGLVLGEGVKYFSGVNGAPIIAENGKRTSDLILLPQRIGTDATVTINYQIIHSGTEMNETAVLDLDDYTTLWEMGKRYIYTITIGLDKIYFNPTVTNWTDVEAGTININN